MEEKRHKRYQEGGKLVSVEESHEFIAIKSILKYNNVELERTITSIYISVIAYHAK